MQAILLVTVFSCLLAAANAAKVALGAACTADGCTDPNAECSTNCVCKSGFTENNGVCKSGKSSSLLTIELTDLAVAEHTIEAACTPAGTSKGNCLDVNAICSTSSKCECKPGYTGTAGGKCVGAPLDATCTYANGGQSNCADANAICTPETNSKCTCKTDYEKSGAICTAKNEGSAPGHLSIWMLCMTFMTMSLAVHVV